MAVKKLFIAFLLFASCGHRQSKVSGPELVKKSIEYHDPNGNWQSLQATFDTRTTYSDSSVVHRRISIDLPQSYFSMRDSSNHIVKSLTIEGENCSFMLNGSSSYTEVQAEEHNLNCETAKRSRSYYTYTLGLPMKLMDPGTVIHPVVETDTTLGKELFRLKVTYEEEVGKDTWYFYVNPRSYRMEVYQFYHDESVNDGEYIILSDEEFLFRGMKFPQLKSWYTNKDGKYLGKDIIEDINGM